VTAGGFPAASAGAREVVPYAVDGIVGVEGETIAVFSEHLTGLDFYLNANMVDADSATRIRQVLQDALDALDKGESHSSTRKGKCVGMSCKFGLANSL